MRREIPQVDLVALWESYGGKLAGPDRGEWRKAVCPLHEDGTASAVVNEDEGVWRCFACSVGGDAIQLIMEKNRVSFLEAIDIAESFGGGAARPRPVSRSSLLPGGSRPDRKGNWTPPWRRIG